MTQQEFKQKCIELRNKNHTLGEIVAILKRPKTSIYTHIRSLPKSWELRAKISDINRARVRLNHKLGLTPQKGKSALGRKYKEFTEWTPALVNLIAHSAFDGEIKYGGIVYNNRSKALIENFKSKMKLIYDFEPKFVLKEDGVMRVSYHNVELAPYFRAKKKELLKIIPVLSGEFQKAFLQAFFNDEGCVTLSSKKRIIRGYQHDDAILILVQKLLKNFDIESKVDARFHEIVISRRENIEKFAKEINFSAGVRVNGKRPNSIWKKSLEKRKILAMALSSYQSI